MNQTCQRKARKAEHRIYTGTNDVEISYFATPYSAHKVNHCLIVRYPQSNIIFATLHPSDIILRGEDGHLRKYTESEFNLMYEVL